jgi:hypothetical protein
MNGFAVRVRRRVTPLAGFAGRTGRKESPMKVRIYSVGFLSPADCVVREYAAIPMPGTHVMGPIPGVDRGAGEMFVVRRTVMEHAVDVAATLFVAIDRSVA